MRNWANAIAQYYGAQIINASVGSVGLTINGASGFSALQILGTGMQIGSPTGGDQGVGSINAVSMFIGGVQIYPGAPVNTFGSSNPSITIAQANQGWVSSASGLTITIPSNASVPFPNGTMLTFQNNGGGTMSIAITADTLQLVNSSTTGTRSLAANAMATAYKVTSTKWIISGAGLT
jgi:hypothetical protein